MAAALNAAKWKAKVPREVEAISMHIHDRGLPSRARVQLLEGATEEDLAKAQTLKHPRETVFAVWRCGSNANRRKAALGPFACPLVLPIAIIGAPIVWAYYMQEKAALDSTLYFLTHVYDRHHRVLLYCHVDGRSCLGKGRGASKAPRYRGLATGSVDWIELKNVRVENSSVFGCSCFSPKAVMIDVPPNCKIANWGGSEGESAHSKREWGNHDGATSPSAYTEHLMPVHNPEAIVQLLRTAYDLIEGTGTSQVHSPQDGASYRHGASGGSGDGGGPTSPKATLMGGQPRSTETVSAVTSPHDTVVLKPRPPGLAPKGPNGRPRKWDGVRGVWTINND